MLSLSDGQKLAENAQNKTQKPDEPYLIPFDLFVMSCESILDSGHQQNQQQQQKELVVIYLFFLIFSR